MKWRLMLKSLVVIIVLLGLLLESVNCKGGRSGSGRGSSGARGGGGGSFGTRSKFILYSSLSLSLTKA